MLDCESNFPSIHFATPQRQPTAPTERRSMSNYRDAYCGKTVLVTGGAGAIGSNLCRELAGLGARVLVLDDLSSGFAWNIPSSPRVIFVQGDILDEVKLKRVFFE